MGGHWNTCDQEVTSFVTNLLEGTKAIIKSEMIGFYLHGSLAMGGFNPKRSDIDIVVVTKSPLAVETKRKLARFFMTHSTQPYLVEVSFVNGEQIKHGEHPYSFDFHYSEFWRDRYETDLSTNTSDFINNMELKDPDLAAHFMIINHRGICIEGTPIHKVFPAIPRQDYISSIMSDFKECLVDITHNPIYCTLNLLRVYWYLKEGVISSKQEAGIWGLAILPQEYQKTVQKIIKWNENNESQEIEERELLSYREYIHKKVSNNW